MLGPYCADDSRRGRRRQAMLESAHQLFVEKGYDSTTLADIVRRSGGSLATLYDMFENKPGLLRALVNERCTTANLAIDSVSGEDDDFDRSLREMAEDMIDRFLDPTYVGLFRIVIAQCIAHPDLGRQIYDGGPIICQARTAEFFAAQMARGTMAPNDPMLVAILFFQMICGDLLSQLAFGLPVDLSPAERTAHLDQVLPIFTRAFAPA